MLLFLFFFSFIFIFWKTRISTAARSHVSGRLDVVLASRKNPQIDQFGKTLPRHGRWRVCLTLQTSFDKRFVESHGHSSLRSLSAFVRGRESNTKPARCINCNHEPDVAKPHRITYIYVPFLHSKCVSHVISQPHRDVG